MVQSPSWEANWYAASHETHRISRNPKVHYRTHKRPPPVSILGQPNPVHIKTSHLLAIHPNIIHPSTPRFHQWSPSLRFPHQDQSMIHTSKKDISNYRGCFGPGSSVCIETGYGLEGPRSNPGGDGVGMISVLQASACNTDTTPTKPHQNSNTHRTKNNTTNVVIQQNSRKLLMMDILISDTCWAHKKWNKISSGIKLVFYSWTVYKHVPL